MITSVPFQATCAVTDGADSVLRLCQAFLRVLLMMSATHARWFPTCLRHRPCLIAVCAYCYDYSHGFPVIVPFFPWRMSGGTNFILLRCLSVSFSYGRPQDAWPKTHAHFLAGNDGCPVKRTGRNQLAPPAFTKRGPSELLCITRIWCRRRSIRAGLL